MKPIPPPQLPAVRACQPVRRMHRISLLLAAIAALGMLTAACGSSTSSSSHTPGATRQSSLLAYAQCMRGHGISDYPDPANQSGGTGFQLGGSGDLNPSNPQYQAANQVCKHLLPNGGVAPSQNAQSQAALLQFAQCMRSHGVEDFPDPIGGTFQLSGQGDLSQNNPQFQTAYSACKSGLSGPIRFGMGR
jgi:hypothetical protein